MNAGKVSDPPLRKNLRFQLLWMGAGASALSNSAINLALPVLILFATGSAVLAGLAAAISITAGIAMGAPAGVWVDRLDRRRILLAAEAAQALIWGSFAAMVYLDAVTVWNVVLMSALSGTAAAFSAPSHAAALQALVPKSQLASAYAQSQARSYAIQLGGPPLGGLLFAISRAAPFLFQIFASAFAIVCYLVARVPRRPLNEKPAASGKPKRTNMRQDIAEAFRWLMGHRGLRAVLGVALFLNPLVNAIWVPIIVLVNGRGGGALDAGIIMAGVGVGGLVGALVSARLSRLVPAGKLVLLVGFVMGLCYCLVPLPLGTLWPIVPIVVSCLASPALNVALMALIGHIVPSNMMGRMSSMLNVTFKGLAPVGPLLGGLLAGALGGSGAMIACGGSLLVLTAIASASPALRSLRAPDASDSEPATAPEQPAPAAAAAEQPSPVADETVRLLHKAGLISTTAAPAHAVFSSLSPDEAALLSSLSNRIRTATEADVMAHGEDSGQEDSRP